MEIISFAEFFRLLKSELRSIRGGTRRARRPTRPLRGGSAASSRGALLRAALVAARERGGDRPGERDSRPLRSPWKKQRSDLRGTDFCCGFSATLSHSFFHEFRIQCYLLVLSISNNNYWSKFSWILWTYHHSSRNPWKSANSGQIRRILDEIQSCKVCLLLRNLTKFR